MACVGARFDPEVAVHPLDRSPMATRRCPGVNFDAPPAGTSERAHSCTPPSRGAILAGRRSIADI